MLYLSLLALLHCCKPFVKLKQGIRNRFDKTFDLSRISHQNALNSHISSFKTVTLFTFHLIKD